MAIAAILSSLLIMIWASLVRNSWSQPLVVMPAHGPPWALSSFHVSLKTVTIALWLAAILGGGGVAAGLAAIRRGARVSTRAVIVTGAIAVAILTALPAAGSTDVFDYAVYGHIVISGHSPYVMTPAQLIRSHDPYSRSVPAAWQNQVSLYGPLATVEQYVAARLGGLSAARIVFWLKLWNSIAFAVVALALDRVLRSDQAARLRGHLLWTVNPLLLWGLIAAGHLDVLAAAAGVLGLLALGTGRSGRGFAAAGKPIQVDLGRAALAGVLIGIAADIKIFYAFYGLAVAWVLRRAPAALATAAGSALFVLVPTYAWFGPPAVKALLARRGKSSADTFYQLFDGRYGSLMVHLALVSGIVVACMLVLVVWRLPGKVQAPPAIPIALAFATAWLFVWPYQLPWYDAMIVCVLVFYPASWIDWLVLARLTAGTLALMTGTLQMLPTRPMRSFDSLIGLRVAPAVLLASAVGLAALCIWGRWGIRGVSGPAAGSASRARQVQPASPGP